VSDEDYSEASDFIEIDGQTGKCVECRFETDCKLKKYLEEKGEVVTACSLNFEPREG